MASYFAQRLRKAIAAVGLGIRATDTERDSVTIWIESGSGAPTHTRPKGSVWLRRDGANANEVVYVSLGAGSWEAVEATLDTSGGAALIGYDPSASGLSATDVQAAIDEILSDLASVATGNGASLIGIEDAGGLYTAATVEAALAEVKGVADAAAVAGSATSDDSAGTSDLASAGPTDDTTTTVWNTGMVAAPVAAAVDYIHARIEDNATFPVTTGITNPDKTRNLTIDFESAWAGGDVTIEGTGWDDAVLSKSFGVVGGGGQRVGLDGYKTVTSINCAGGGPGGANHGLTVGVGNALSVSCSMAAPLGACSISGAPETCTWDGAGNLFTPTNLPDGSRNYFFGVPMSKAHSHNITGTHSHPMTGTHHHTQN